MTSFFPGHLPDLVIRPFQPKPWARNPHIQSMLASSRLRAPLKNEMARSARPVMLDGGDGVRLLGFHSVHTHRKPKALVLILHGWEGSADSIYVLRTGRFLYRRGCDIFRLNLRDHGVSHHLNPGIFHGALTGETVAAVRHAAKLSPDRSFFVVGFSLGGNFAMRLAQRRTGAAIGSLRHVIAISPTIDPLRSTLCIDNGLFLYRHYFLRKWKRSLRRKQVLFPRLYHFDDMLRMDRALAMTEALIRRYTDFKDYRDYFNRYTLSGDALDDLTVPVSVITAADDPVIPVDDFYPLRGKARLRLLIQAHGGHCGFIDPFPCGSWYDAVIDNIIRSAIDEE